MPWPFSRVLRQAQDERSVGPVPGECGQREGRWRVRWRWHAKEWNDEDAYLPLAMHEDSPTLSVKRPYVGPLCPHELQFLRGEDNTHVISTQWTFEVTPA